MGICVARDKHEHSVKLRIIKVELNHVIVMEMILHF